MNRITNCPTCGQIVSDDNCPSCGHNMTTQQPLIPESKKISLNSIIILRKGVYYFQTYPHLLLICLVAICVDVVIMILGLIPPAILDLSAFLLWMSLYLLMLGQLLKVK